MQSFNFTCPYCKKVMAVSHHLLGKNVRCPHCRQVVVAPSTPPPTSPTKVSQPNMSDSRPTTQSNRPLPEFNFAPPPKESVESIFGESADDDLFGTKPKKPIFPPKESIPSPTTEETLWQSPDEQNQSKPSISPANSSSSLPTKNFSPIRNEIEESIPTSEEVSREEDSLADTVPSRRIYQPQPRPTEKSTGILTWIVLLWAIGASGVAVYFSLARQKSHPFEAIPDVYGEYEKTDRKKTSWKHLPSERLQVPEEQLVDLGKSLAIHDLEFTPMKVEFGRWDFRDKSSDEFKPIPNATFLLRLKVKNVSKDLVLFPTDPAFNRKKTDLDLGPVYNNLSVGSSRFQGGLFPWPSVDGSIGIVKGQEEDSTPLQPGDTRETVIPSCIASGMQTALEENKNSLCTWRIQLRTGLVSFRDESGVEREMSVTSVIGVRFQASQIAIVN